MDEATGIRKVNRQKMDISRGIGQDNTIRENRYAWRKDFRTQKTIWYDAG